MIVYIPFLQAVELSRLLWTLTDADPARGTAALFPVVEALDQSLWLRVGTSRSIPVLPNADVTELVSLLAANGIQQDEIDLFSQQVVASYGQRLVVWGHLPISIKSQALDLQGMIAAGLLPEPVIP